MKKRSIILIATILSISLFVLAGCAEEEATGSSMEDETAVTEDIGKENEVPKEKEDIRDKGQEKIEINMDDLNTDGLSTEQLEAIEQFVSGEIDIKFFMDSGLFTEEQLIEIGIPMLNINMKNKGKIESESEDQVEQVIDQEKPTEDQEISNVEDQEPYVENQEMPNVENQEPKVKDQEMPGGPMNNTGQDIELDIDNLNTDGLSTEQVEAIENLISGELDMQTFMESGLFTEEELIEIGIPAPPMDRPQRN